MLVFLAEEASKADASRLTMETANAGGGHASAGVTTLGVGRRRIARITKPNQPSVVVVVVVVAVVVNGCLLPPVSPG